MRLTGFVFRSLKNRAVPPVFQRYDFLRRLGSGAFGTVYLCRGRDGRYVAVKEIQYKNDDVSTHRKAISREIETLRSLDHPNVVQLIECIPDESSNSISMLVFFSFDPHSHFPQV